MRNVLRVVLSVFVLGGVSVSGLTGQLWEAGEPGEDVFSFALTSGVLSPRKSLPNGGSFESGVAFGLAATVWAHRYLGFRVAVVRSETNGADGGAFTVESVMDPDVYLYDVGAVLRLPMTAGNTTWFPYASAGVGGKTYRWAIQQTGGGGTSIAIGNVALGGGLEVRPAGWFGLQAEVRYHRSKYEFHEFEFLPQDMADLVFKVGVTLNR